MDVTQNFLKSNVIEQEDSINQIKSTLDFISKTVSKTLGPYGSNTIIQDRELNHFLTKDGYNVLKKIYFYYDLPKTVLDIVKKISRKLVKEVGDGSTSSIVVANALFQNIVEISQNQSISPQEVIDILNEMSEILERYIYENSTKVDHRNFDDIITKIASLAVNNTEKYGKLICEIFNKIGRFGFINLELSNSNEDSYEIINGIEIKHGFIDINMANDNDGKDKCIFENCNVFMCNDNLDDSDMNSFANLLENVCIDNQKPLLVIANGYSDSMKSFFHLNIIKSKKTLPIVAIEMDTKTKKGRNRFNDIATILQCRFYDKLNGEMLDDINTTMDIVQHLGFAESVIVSEMNTQIIGGIGYDSEEANKIKDELQLEYNRIYNLNDPVDHDSELFELRKRLANFNSSVAKLYIGGNSETEKETKKFLLEDAILACRSTLDNGYIIGGNLIIPKILNSNDENIVEELHSKFEKIDIDIIKKIVDSVRISFRTSFKTVLSNAYYPDEKCKEIIDECITNNKIFNVKTKEYEDIESTKIINSVRTDIEIMKSCISIIGLLATSNQFITINSVMEKR